jgi:CO/xanthine dehydrogenase Mo-binding subunit
MSAIEEKTNGVFGATLSRKKFVTRGGALVAALSVPVAFSATDAGAGAVSGTSLDPSQLSSWLEIHADNSVLIRTGQGEMGQGSATGAYPQIVAEELNVPYDSISVVVGNTNETPDGGLSAGFLMKRPGQTQPQIFGGGALNLQLVAAGAYQALLSLASTKLGVPVGSLSVKDGIVSGGGKTISYGQLVSGQQLNLTIPYTGTAVAPPPGRSSVTVTLNTPVKPVSQYTVVGTSQPMKAIPGIISGKTPYVADIHLPGMLHARIVRPPTLGSTLVALGKLDSKAYPQAQIVSKGNLVAVLSPREWEAIGAAAQVAASTKWTAWEGLPGSGNTEGVLRNTDWSLVPTTFGGRSYLTGGNSNVGNADAAFPSAAKIVTASYFKPFAKHGPIGPSITLADVSPTGLVQVWTAGQAVQTVRTMVANALGTSTDNVIVHWTQGAGSYGRQHGAEHSEVDAVILSQIVGKPVRVTWMRNEDFQWSVTSSAFLMDMKAGLDKNGNMIAFQAHYHAPQVADDGRPPGAVLAGMPAGPAPALSLGVSNEWPYDKVPNVDEQGHGSLPFGASSPLGMGIRGHNMRTPSHREENWALEALVSEAAATAGVDPIEYRIRHTNNQRLIDVLNRLKAEHGWVTRPSPSPKARATGTGIVSGQGVGVMLRFNTVWATAMNIDVDLKTGRIRPTKYTVVVEPGLAVNPRQLTRMTEGGMVQGISEALFETMTFNKSNITSVDWVTYPIMRFQDSPKITFDYVQRTDIPAVNTGTVQANGTTAPSSTTASSGVFVSGSGEPPSTCIGAAIANAFFDATGVRIRTAPMTAAMVRATLKAAKGGGLTG